MMTKIKVYSCYTVKIYKKQTPKKFKQGAAQSWIRLWSKIFS